MAVTKVSHDEPFNSVDNSVGSEAPKQQQNFELGQLRVPFWELFGLRLFVIVPSPPVLFVVFQIVDYVLEVVINILQHLQVFPSDIWDPFIRLGLLHLLKRSVSFEEKVELFIVEVFFSVFDHEGHLQGEH